MSLDPDSESDPTNRMRVVLVAALLSAIALLYVYTGLFKAIGDDGDALYSSVARAMAESGDWVTPYSNGVRFFDKPPLMYWLMGVSYAAAGPSEFSVRIPSFLAVIGTTWLVYLLGARLSGPRGGLAGGAGFALCLGTFFFTREVFPDVYFVFFLTLSVFAFLKWFEDEASPLVPALVFYASLAGAALSKGLIGIVFPCAIVFLFFLVTKEWQRLRRTHWLAGTFVFLLLAAPWHLLMAWRHEKFLWLYFVNEHFLRFLGKREPYDYISISLPVFWALILVWLFPWSAFLPAVRHLLHGNQGDSERYTIGVLVLVWSAFVLVFFTLSARLEHYAFPLLPPLAVLVGAALFSSSREAAQPSAILNQSLSRCFAFLALMGPLLSAGLAIALVWLAQTTADPDLASARLRAYPNLFGPILDLPRETVRAFLGPLVPTMIGLTVGTAGAWWLNRKGKRPAAVVLLCIMPVTFMLAADQSIRICEDILSSKHFGVELARLYQPGDSLVVVGDFETANSVNFYSSTPLLVYQGTAALIEIGSRYPDAPEVVISATRLQQRWNGSDRTFLLVPDSEVEALPIDPEFIMIRSAGRTLYCNQAT